MFLKGHCHEIFDTLKNPLPEPDMNSQNRSREIFRFREDIREKMWAMLGIRIWMQRIRILIILEKLVEVFKQFFSLPL